MFYSNEYYNNFQTLIFHFNPKVQIQMNYINKCMTFDQYMIFETNIPNDILEDWLEICNPNKIILSWSSTYFMT